MVTGLNKLRIPALLVLSVISLSGCGRVPVDIQRATSPCIELPRAQGFDSRTILTAMLELDFKQKDANNDGVVTLSEVEAKPNKPNLIDQKLMKAIGIKDGQLAQADLRKAGDTIVSWAVHYKSLLLDRYDKSRDHQLTFDEVKGLFGIDEAAFKAADERSKGTPGNGDGRLNEEEFLGLVLKMNQTTAGCAAADADTAGQPVTAAIRR